MQKNVSYCKEFIDKSKYVYNWINKQPSVGEESLTDWLLFALSESLPSVKYKSFTRHEEAKETGSDWEWWFVDVHQALCFRIQAKKISEKKDNYFSIAYQNQYGMQIEKLIDNAQNNNFLPFYIFYYASQRKTKVLCSDTLWNKFDCGIFISSATKLYNDFILNGRKKVTPQDILIRSNPFYCLVCSHSLKNVQSIYEHLKMYYPDILETNSNSLEPGLHKEIPPYIQILLKFNGNIPKYEEEFKEQTKEIKNLIVVDLREDSNKQINGKNILKYML